VKKGREKMDKNKNQEEKLYPLTGRKLEKCVKWGKEGIY
jgi:hypothetical protein